MRASECNLSLEHGIDEPPKDARMASGYVVEYLPSNRYSPAQTPVRFIRDLSGRMLTSGVTGRVFGNRLPLRHPVKVRQA